MWIVAENINAKVTAFRNSAFLASLLFIVAVILVENETFFYMYKSYKLIKLSSERNYVIEDKLHLLTTK